MIVLYEVDHSVFHGNRPITAIKGWFVRQNGKRVAVTQYISRFAHPSEIDETKTRIKEQLACIK